MAALLARTPEANRVLQWFVERVEERVRRETPSAVALVLTGSASRGEATVLPWNERSFVLSDLDLAALFADRGARDRAAPRLARASRGLAQEFARWDFLGAVDLGAYALEDLPRQAPRPGTLEWERSGVVLHGDAAILDRLPRYEASAIPPEEALLLCENRLLELLWVEPLAHGPDRRSLAALYAGAKGVLDAALALLISRGECPATLEERCRTYVEMRRREPSGSGGPDPTALEFWTRMKLEPEPSALAVRFGPESSAWALRAWREGGEALLAAYQVLVERHAPPRSGDLLVRAASRARHRRRLRRALDAWRERRARGLAWARPTALWHLLLAGAPEHVLGAAAAGLVAEALGGQRIAGEVWRAPGVPGFLPDERATWEERRARAVEIWDRWVLRGARHGRAA